MPEPSWLLPIWSAGSPLSAGLLTTVGNANAAPHWPLRLTSALPCLSLLGCISGLCRAADYRQRCASLAFKLTDDAIQTVMPAVRRVSGPAGLLTTVSAAPHWPCRLTDDVLQAAVPVWFAGSLLSAGLLTAASASPHWPIRLTHDALQAVVPVRRPASAGLLTTASVAPHWPPRLTSALPCLCLSGCCPFGLQGLWPLQGCRLPPTLIRRLTGLSGSQMTRSNLSCLFGSQGLRSLQGC